MANRVYSSKSMVNSETRAGEETNELEVWRKQTSAWPVKRLGKLGNLNGEKEEEEEIEEQEYEENQELGLDSEQKERVGESNGKTKTTIDINEQNYDDNLNSMGNAQFTRIETRRGRKRRRRRRNRPKVHKTRGNLLTVIIREHKKAKEEGEGEEDRDTLDYYKCLAINEIGLTKSEQEIAIGGQNCKYKANEGLIKL